MDKAIPLALAASLCTATSSVCQRLGARDSQPAGLDPWLLFRLARRPIWLVGIASMILGFAFQLTALHYGALALVQPILALELLFVFGYMALLGARTVKRRDWLAAAAMSAGLALFLFAASPSGGRQHAPAGLWLLAGLATVAVVFVGLALAFGLGRRPSASGAHRAAILGAVTGVAWGFVAAVIKEFSYHLGNGLAGVFSNWSVYVLIGAGAASLLLASHALAAGPLAASQPGFTILDPLAASLLGLFLFGEHFQAGSVDLAIEALALALLVSGVSALSHSHLIAGEEDEQPAGAAQAAVHSGPLVALDGPAPDQRGNADPPGQQQPGSCRSTG
jgi:drug/metabolite transporter (DMT)-like permease